MSFEKALAFVLAREGGYVDNPRDRGGETNMGITQQTYATWRATLGLPIQPVKFVTRDEAEKIYQKRYWQPSKCDLMPSPIDLMHFDASVQHGQRQAAKFLQRALSVHDDGMIGKTTLAALSEAYLPGLVDDCIRERELFYQTLIEKDPTQIRFRHGWLSRIGLLKDEAEKQLKA